MGLASRDGIIPLALTQDTGGPIARTVTDAAVALDSVTGVDAADPVTSEQQGLVPESYTSFLDADALAGTRIGYVTSMVSTNRTTARLFADALVTLQAQGATIVPIATPPSGFAAVLAEGSGSTNKFKHDLDAYVAKHLAPNVEARSLQGVLASGKYVPSRAGTYGLATPSPRRPTRGGQARPARTPRPSRTGTPWSRRCWTIRTSTR